MKTTIETQKEAHRICLELWEHVEIYFKGARKQNIDDAKEAILASLGYEDLDCDCPLCAYYWSTLCRDCPLYFCVNKGFKSYMNGKEVAAFNAFVKKKLQSSISEEGE